eukprot:TRINITY_DN29739_c0_g1_i1.p1 TRINITY_DN29739_c0_g1~~TRINITY_DN29739_c0_g1_i1.p1  ORF type:complete len:192 (+),score=48.73 TRINITY_DN29739_c0_g1_i1:49-576(+)
MLIGASRRALAASRPWAQARRWCGGDANAKKSVDETKKKKYEEMTDAELEEAAKKLTWWPYLLVGGVLTFIWIPEYTKFVWHLKLQMWVHEQYWKLVLPKEEAASVIREARIGIPASHRTSQNPLAACPLRSNEDGKISEEELKGIPLPPGHPNPFAAGIIQAAEELKNARPRDG